jgi:7-carboxy-7-deazaguanine synthase
MKLNVNEIFSSVQGEGIHTGIPTLFIRLAGCDLRCRWCDTPYALELGSGESMDMENIIQIAKDSECAQVCLTGGEPLFQKATVELVRIIVENGFRIDIETNGSHDIKDFIRYGDQVLLSIDVKSPSSGEEDSFLYENLEWVREFDQLKFIIKNDEDMEFALLFLENHMPVCNVIFTPCDNTGAGSIVERILNELKNPKRSKDFRNILKRSRTMIQTHKVIWSDGQRGV